MIPRGNSVWQLYSEARTLAENWLHSWLQSTQNMQLRQFLQLFPFVLLGSSAQKCKNYPGDAAWPDSSTWQSLNESVSGRLCAPFGLGNICHPSSPNFSNLSCYALNVEWGNTTFVATNPWLADYNDESCPPDGNTICTTAGYPAYVIIATSAADVQAGVNFARTHNVRLVVKGTGHDFPGRSSGSGSLSIYTHNIRGVSVNIDDPYAVSYGGVAAVTIAAGMRWGEVYAEMAEHNITVVGGADPHVGVGGWTLNGGHSPISSLYGMGADQVLSLEVVTADGQHLIVNETSSPDLFWALRGGGGSTFAIMLSVTVKAYPNLSGNVYSYSYATKANSDTFWSLLTYFHTQIPRISEAGGMGYHYLTRGSSLGQPDIDLITGGWMFPQKTIDQAQQIIASLEAGLNTSSWSQDSVYASGTYTTFDNAMYALSQSPGETAGFSGRLGSWLLDGPALTDDFDALKAGLKAANPSPWNMISHVVAGPGVRNAANDLPGGSNAVLPAWRKAYTHIGKSDLLATHRFG